MGNFVFGSPLALLLAIRGTLATESDSRAERDDADRAIAMARAYDTATVVFATITSTWHHDRSISSG